MTSIIFATNNQNKVEKTMKTIITSTIKPKLLIFDNMSKQFKCIIDKIKKLMQDNKYKYHDFTILSRNAEFLKVNSKVDIQVEGHCDERGGRQYNLALGERRAKASRDYLVALGVEAKRIDRSIMETITINP